MTAQRRGLHLADLTNIMSSGKDEDSTTVLVDGASGVPSGLQRAASIHARVGRKSVAAVPPDRLFGHRCDIVARPLSAADLL
jgi:hypothetical protein